MSTAGTAKHKHTCSKDKPQSKVPLYNWLFMNKPTNIPEHT
eukprot:CAMPEP_0183415146 /NCGR_PEP_ID=MMETSP0370-20130417/22888_1 /TAXON_ID=268820 /ORGANISM="Peridinium aciculiferum, Strain PAER-2" /LENGTH=40 /DNA_ID= /DNA_START= /DNA_END= /DNA_ORIENTATION=